VNGQMFASLAVMYQAFRGVGWVGLILLPLPACIV
jgi:hypothetical protein